MISGLEVDTSVEMIDHISLEVGASSENLRLARLIVSAFGSNHGADLDDLEDLRIATGDLCAHLISDAPSDARLALAVSVLRCGPVSTPTVALHAEIARPGGPEQLDEISTLILGAATDTFGSVDHESAWRGTWTPDTRGSRYGYTLKVDTDIPAPDRDGPADGVQTDPAGPLNAYNDETGRSVSVWFSRAIRAEADAPAETA